MLATKAKQGEDGGSKRAATVGRSTSAEDLSTYSGRLGKRMRKRREDLAMSVKEFADALDVQIPTVYHWESGRNPVPMDSLPAIAKALKTTIHELLPKR